MFSKFNKRMLFVALAFALAISLAGCAELEKYLAEATDGVPTEYRDIAVAMDPELTYISTDELMALFEEKAGGGADANRDSYDEPANWAFAPVDVRERSQYDWGHVNGAVNIPASQFAELSSARLPEDKSKQLVIYSGGWDCPLAAEVANKAIAAGYENVLVFQAGVEHGLKNSTDQRSYLAVTPEVFREVLTQRYMMDETRPPVLVLDNRPYAGYYDGHIPFSIAADTPEPWNSRYSGLAPTNKQTEIFAY